MLSPLSPSSQSCAAWRPFSAALDHLNARTPYAIASISLVIDQLRHPVAGLAGSPGVSALPGASKHSQTHRLAVCYGWLPHRPFPNAVVRTAQLPCPGSADLPVPGAFGFPPRPVPSNPKQPTTNGQRATGNGQRGNASMLCSQQKQRKHTSLQEPPPKSGRVWRGRALPRTGACRLGGWCTQNRVRYGVNLQSRGHTRKGGHRSCCVSCYVRSLLLHCWSLIFRGGETTRPTATTERHWKGEMERQS